MKTAPRVHFYEYDYRQKEILPEENLWESGYWSHFLVETAEYLKSNEASIYFHNPRLEKPYMGGKIVGYRSSTGDEKPNTIVFIFKRYPDIDDADEPGSDGWEPSGRPYKKIVR